MICKWCGAEIAAKDKKCGRCGRDVTPSSECGGFYDLVPGAKTVAPPTTPAAPVSQVPSTSVPVAPPVQPSKKPFNLSLLLTTILCVLWLITLVFMINLSFDMDELDKERNDLEEKVEELADQIEEYRNDRGETPIPNTNEPPTTEDAPGSENPDKPAGAVDLVFNKTENDAEVETKDESVSVKMVWKEEKKDEESAAVVTVSLAFSANEMIYGAAEDVLVTYAWQYRVDDGEWQELTDKFTADKQTVTYSPEALMADLLAKSGTKVEMRCVITRTNVDAETLTVTVTGIIAAEKPEANENPDKPAGAVDLTFKNTENDAEVKTEDESVNVKMVWKEEKKDEESAAIVTLSLHLNVNEDTYGAAAQSDSEAYTWQYRVDDGEWQELTDKFTADKETVTYSPEVLMADLLAKSGTKVELRCVITRTNADAETLTVTVNGMIAAEKPAVEA